MGVCLGASVSFSSALVLGSNTSILPIPSTSPVKIVTLVPQGNHLKITELMSIYNYVGTGGCV